MLPGKLFLRVEQIEVEQVPYWVTDKGELEKRTETKPKKDGNSGHAHAIIPFETEDDILDVLSWLEKKGFFFDELLLYGEETRRMFCWAEMYLAEYEFIARCWMLSDNVVETYPKAPKFILDLRYSKNTVVVK